MSRPGWRDDYWKRMDKETARKLRTRCPRCGSSNTSYNKLYKAWRCNKCENSFVVRGLDDTEPWWKRILPFRKQ